MRKRSGFGIVKEPSNNDKRIQIQVHNDKTSNERIFQAVINSTYKTTRHNAAFLLLHTSLSTHIQRDTRSAHAGPERGLKPQDACCQGQETQQTKNWHGLYLAEQQKYVCWIILVWLLESLLPRCLFRIRSLGQLRFLMSACHKSFPVHGIGNWHCIIGNESIERERKIATAETGTASRRCIKLIG
jgi:hypothetical protein